MFTQFPYGYYRHRFAPKITSCVVWSDGVFDGHRSLPVGLQAFIQDLLVRYVDPNTVNSTGKRFDSIGHQDKRGALICALLAHAFTFQPDT